MPKLGVRTKLLLSTLLVLVPILILLIWNFSAAYSERKDQLLADQGRVAQTASVAIGNVFDGALTIDRAYAMDPVIKTFNGPTIDAYLTKLADLRPEYQNFLGVFDAQGNLVGSATRTEPLYVGDRQWFQELMRTGQPVISEVLISRVNGRPVVVTAAPITGTDSTIAGAASSALSLDYLPQMLSSVQRAPGQEIFLTDHTGRIAFYTSMPNITWEQRDASQYPPVRTALEGQAFSSASTKGLRGEDRMIVAIPTPKYGWAVGVSVLADLALAPVRSALRDTLIVFAIVVAFSLGLALLLAELFTRPLRQLTEKAMALGRGKLQERVQIKTGDELERLGDSFNAMATEMQRALQLREEFLSVASHEIRTPLTIIKGHAQWLLMRETDERKRRALGIVVKQVDRIVELLNEMLMVSELRAGRMPMEKRRLDLTALVAEIAERMQSMAEDHRLVFQREEPVIVDADPDQLEVVVTHLIDNGMRYSAKGTSVEITVGKTRTEAVVSVKDYGQGIPQEEQAHVFEAFFQMQPGIAGYGGLGLGLFISKEIVERHGGRIWFESREGQGSTFYFSLPLAQPES